MRKKDLALALAALTLLPSWGPNLSKKTAPTNVDSSVYMKEFSFSLGDFSKDYRIKMRELEREAYDHLTQYKTNDFNSDPIDYLIARLMMGEREGYQDIYKITDAWTALTRAIYNKTTIREEILRKKQYSCFNPDLDSSKFLKDPIRHNRKDFLINIQLARDFIDGKYPNPMPGATHYFNPKKVKKIPPWAIKLTFIGEMKDHFYYRERNKEPITSFSDISDIQKYIK